MAIYHPIPIPPSAARDINSPPPGNRSSTRRRLAARTPWQLSPKSTGNRPINTSASMGALERGGQGPGPGVLRGAARTGYAGEIRPEKGRLRTYLRACLDRFVMKQDESARTPKAGGRAQIVVFDFDTAERELAGVRADTPEEIFFREWQREMFGLAVAALRSACRDVREGCAVPDLRAIRPRRGERPGMRTWPRRKNPGDPGDQPPRLGPAGAPTAAPRRLQTVTSGDRESRAELRTLFGAP